MHVPLETEYTITAGNLIKGLTMFVVILLLFIAIFVPFSLYYYEGEPMAALYLGLFFSAIFLLIIGLTWAYSPQKYTVSDTGIRIIRPLSSFLISISKIKKIEDRTYSNLKLWKMGGNGGLFSFTGSFYTKEDGKFWMYAKNNNYVMIYTTEKKFVLSPDEKEQFMLDVNSRLNRNKKTKK